jgi:hypothetical protein
MILSENKKILFISLISIFIGCILGTVTFIIVKHIQASKVPSKNKVCPEQCPTGQICDTESGTCKNNDPGCSKVCTDCNLTNACGDSCKSIMCDSSQTCQSDGSCNNPGCYENDEDIFGNNCAKGVKCCTGSLFCRKRQSGSTTDYTYFCHKDTCPNGSELVTPSTTPKCLQHPACKKNGSQFCTA